MTVKDKEILRYSIPNFFPDFMNDFNPEDAEETMEEIGRNRPAEGKEGDVDDENEDENREEDNEKKMIYVWKKGMELEERKVVRENQEKIEREEKSFSQHLFHQCMREAPVCQNG
mgnify:CR=1 FL=1